jgi:hypothetical protein
MIPTTRALHPFLSLSSTDDRRVALEQIIRDAECKAYNENQCLHRNPAGHISLTPSSTGLYRMPALFMVGV